MHNVYEVGLEVVPVLEWRFVLQLFLYPDDGAVVLYADIYSAVDM